MKGFNSSMADDYHTSQSNLMAADPQQQQHQQQQQQPQQQQRTPAQQDLYSSGSGRQSAGIVDEMQQDLTYLSREAPLDGGESTFGAATSYSQLGLAGGSQRGESVLQLANSQDQLYNNSSTRTNQEDDLLADWHSRQDGAGSPTATSYNYNEQALNQLAPDNVDIQRPLQQAGQFQEQLQQQQTVAVDAPAESRPLATDVAFSQLKELKPFLVSFMVDARGGAMRGCRHSGVRVIIPPNSAQMPMRITCRYLRRERLVHPPPLMEGEACASKIMEVGPAGAKFLTPVLIEVPHFASLRGKEREIIILRSDSGEVWREHLFEADQRLVGSIIRSAGHEQQAPSAGQADKENVANSSGGGGFDDQANDDDGGGDKRRLTRIVTNEFPQYFAIISRVRQEVHPVGPDGSTVDSQVVDRVQAIFTEGALTKRIKIGLQKQEQHSQQAEHQAAEQSAAPLAGPEEERSGSPAAGSSGQHQDRAVSPQSGGSATTKRRSRFLACFGAGHGSIDPLNNNNNNNEATDADSSVAGDSPRQPCKEKPVKKRFILGDVNDSDADSTNSQAADSPASLSRKRRHTELLAREQLVPDDYYIEVEPPLILNVEPKTYGKRMASSSAQTDSKLNGSSGFIMTTLAKKSKKRRRGLLGRRKHKTQMNICCEPAPTLASRPKSAEPLVDSSLESALATDEPRQDPADSISMIHDVVTSDDLKWRTCTIQTDSDSVTVNYVTLNAVGEAAAAAAAAVASSGGGAAGDDGYVSGSGDLKKDSSFGKGLFNLSFGSSAQADESKAARKKGKADRKKKPSTKKETTSDEDEKASSTGGGGADDDQQQQQQLANLDESTRSVSPTSKELKLREKLERQERQRREKEEKRLQKESEEAAAKAEKLRRKQEKEAKKKAQKGAKKSPPASPVPPQPDPQTGSSKSSGQQVVKFAAELVSSEDQNREPVRQLDSIQNVIDSTSASYEQQKERLSQEDGRDMIEVDIGDTSKLAASSEPAKSAEAAATTSHDIPDKQQQQDDASIVSRTLEVHHSIAKTLQDGKDELERAEEKLISLSSADDQPASIDSSTQSEQQQQPLRPILKQQSTAEEISAELTIGDERSLASKLVGEVTEEAVRAADRLRSSHSSPEPADPSSGPVESPISSSSLSKKEEKERLKREAKEEKQRSKEAKKLKKEAERLAKAEQEQLAKEAKLERERLAKEAKLEKERLAKEAKFEKERLAKESKEAKRAAAVVEAPESPKVGEQVEQLAAEPVHEDTKSPEIEDESSSAAKRRFKIRLPKFGSPSKKSSSQQSPPSQKQEQEQQEVKSDESEPATAPADDSEADDSAAISAAAAKVVEEAVAEAERLAALEMSETDADETINQVGEEPKVEATEPIAQSEPLEVADEKKAKKSAKFRLTFPKFNSSSSPSKSTSESAADESSSKSKSKSEESRSKSKPEKARSASNSEAQLAEALEALKKATLEARAEHERLAREAEDGELSAELKEAKLKLALEAKAKAADAEKAAKEAGKKFKLGSKFKVKLPKFGSSPVESSSNTSGVAAPATVPAEQQPGESGPEELEEPSMAGQKATDVSEGSPIEASLSVEQPTDELASGKKEKTKKNKKKKKQAKTTSSSRALESASDESEPTTNSASRTSGGFFSRLFSGKSKASNSTAPPTADATADQSLGATNVEPSVDSVAASQQQQQQRDEPKPLIVSEMYPSDPDDEDGEMILEVNLPHNLLQDNRRKESAPINEPISQSASDTLATTIDETLATSTAAQQQLSSCKPTQELSSPTISIEQHQEQQHQQKQQPICKAQVSLDHDDQATLVNVSQIMSSSDSINRADNDDDDDDATENLASQANDLVLEASVSAPPPAELQTAAHSEATEKVVASEAAPEPAKRGKPSKEELKAEKAKKELESKLAKEAKKQAKEDEKLKKKQAKEDKLRAQEEEKQAKRLAKERAELEKRQAKESKRLEKLANKKSNKNKTATPAAAVVVTDSEQVMGSTSASGGEHTTLASAPESQPQLAEEPAQTISEGSRILSETPINTETEVERIVEEVVGADGILTKTTKLIETKYVTTRREELRTSEHREIPLEEYERMKLVNLADSSRESKRLSLSSSSSSKSNLHQHDELPAASQVLAAHENQELEEICATPSFFGPQLPEGVSAELTQKKALKRRFKLNQRLIKRAHKLAKSESKRAKKSARAASSEIAVCDEAAKQARKELKRAIKEAKRARKEAAKAHKKMDKVDKKLAKREKKIQKRQRKLDKRAAKLAKKEAKVRAKLEAKEAKKLKRSSSASPSGGGGSKKSIRLEDIGDPVLKSSSRLSIGGETLAASPGDHERPGQQIVIERHSPASEELQVVEMSLEDNNGPPATCGPEADLEVHHTITTTTTIEHPDGQVSEQTSHQVLTGQEASEAARRLDQLEADDNGSEEIDVVNDLPDIHVAARRRTEAQGEEEQQ